MIGGSSAREIVASVEEAVAAGALKPGGRLPSVRRLAAELSVSPSTVASAVAELRRRGVVVSRPRSGVVVADRPPLATAALSAPVPDGVRDLASGNPDPRFLPDLGRVLRSIAGPPPRRDAARPVVGAPAVSAVLRADPGPAPTLQRLYGEEAVLPELRHVATEAFARDGIDAGALCAVNGALDGVERVLQAELTPGDAVAVEDPGFPGVLDLARVLGLALVPVPVDALGMRPAALDSALRQGARAVVLTPRGQNPTGAALDERRRRQLAGVLRRHPDALLVEDDHLGPVAGAEYRTLTAGRRRWAAVRSVSKWLGPDLRLAVVAADPRTLGRVEGRQAVGPGWVSAIVQRVVAACWSDAEVAALAEQAATVYAGRRRALVEALAAAGVVAPAGSGLNVWIPVADEDLASRALLSAGFAVSAGSRYRMRSGPGLRVTTAALPPADAPAVAAALRPSGRTRAA